MELLNLKEKNKQNKNSSFNDNNIVENNLKILIKQKKVHLDNLLKNLSSNPDLNNIIVPKIKELNFELDQLNKEQDKSNDKMGQSNCEESNFATIKYLFENCSIIDALTQYETKELIRGLIKNITWNGTTEDLTIYFNSRNED